MFPLVVFTRKVTHSNVLLPKTKFPLRINSSKRKERDSWIMKTACFDQLYKWQRQNMQHGNEFVLHDGPPYANGKPHMGHALNKILKDVVIRYELLCGKLVNYIPGWDCHGLPIELKALEATNILQSDVLDIRQRAKSFALDTIKIQKAAFSQWGVMADWENGCYYTFSPTYVISQLKLFCDLHEKELIYREYKPVYWSPSSRTALAESELEYNTEHVSTSVYLKLELRSPLPESMVALSKYSPVYLVVWTTTPWTIPANQAVCFHPEKKYCLLLCETGKHQEYLIIASDLCASLEQLWSCKFTVINEFMGNAFKGHYYYHPINKSELVPLLPGYHISMKKGTGLVHTAPAHGPEDFLVALQHKLTIMNLVDDNGTYSSDAGEILSGLSVLDEGQKTVLQILENDIIYQEDFRHSYPYDWRTKKPVILRASLQWFIDTDKIKHQAINAMEEVAVLPANLEKPMLNQLAQRPYWCISRQRSWGVPIPVFYKSRNPVGKEGTIVNREIINRLCDLISKKGVDQWWTVSPEELIGNELMHKLNLTPGHIYKGMDIMDIWFDSGVSWNTVLPQGRQADLYLEGIDQFGGWFQSSLLTSVASTGRAPYKSIFVHGFALDSQGRKMSKSEGNVIDPTTITDGDGKKQQAVGIDVLRWWTACHVSGNGSSVLVSPQSIQQASEDVQKLRSVLRFLLGNIDGVTLDQLEKLDISSLRVTDRYMLNLLTEFVTAALSAYREMNFRKITSLLLHFINSSVSAFYCNIVKDRLYCHGSTSENRLSVLYVLSEISDQVTLVIAPILPHLTEEVEIYHPWHSDKGGLFRNRRYTSVKDFTDPSVVEWMKPSLALRNAVNKEIGCLNTQEWDVTIVVSSLEDLKLLQKLQQEEIAYDSAMCELLQVSMVTISSKHNFDSKAQEETTLNLDGRKKLEIHHFGLIEITLSKTSLLICPRCRRNTSSDGQICNLCSKTISAEKVSLS